MRKPPICAGVAEPLMISPITARASSRLRSCPSRSRARPSWIVIASPPGSSSRERGPVGREHRLRVELDAVDRELAVPDRHHFAVLRGRADLEGLGDARRGERVVAAALEWIGQAREETLAVVGDRARLPVHQALGLADLAAVGLHDRLVAEAHAEGRHALAQPADDLQAGARVGRPAGPRGDDQVARLELLRRVGVDLVVADDGHLGAELLEEVREVVRERVVVVDEEDHAAPSASSSAASSAASLRRHSSCSAAGSESATMPAPACSGRARPRARPCGSRCRCRRSLRGARSRPRPRTGRGGNPRARR